MALNKQRILSELGSVVNQLQSAECGCMGKLFSDPGQGSSMGASPMQPYGGCRMGCCHGHGSSYSGEPCSPSNNQFMHRPCLGNCNPPRLYADTYSYLNKNLMQPVVNEVYNDLKSISPDNTIMNNPMASKMGLSPTNAAMAGQLGQGNMAGMAQTPMAGGSMGGDMSGVSPGYNVNMGMGNTNASPQMGQQNQYMGQMDQPMGQMSQPMGQMSQPMGQMSQPMGQMSQPMGQMSQPMDQSMGQMNQQSGLMSQFMGQTNQPMNQMGGMGAQIMKMMTGDGSSKPAAMPVQNGQMADSMLTTPQTPNNQVGTPMNAPDYGTNATMHNMNYQQNNTGAYAQNPTTQYMSHSNAFAGNAAENAMPQHNMFQNNMNSNPTGMAQNQPMGSGGQPMAANRYGQHAQGMKKFSEMFPGVTQGDLGFDPMSIAIQMNPANQQQAALSSMEKLMNGQKTMNIANMQPTLNAANAAIANIGQSVAAPNQQGGVPNTPIANQPIMQNQAPQQSFQPVQQQQQQPQQQLQQQQQLLPQQQQLQPQTQQQPQPQTQPQTQLQTQPQPQQQQQQVYTATGAPVQYQQSPSQIYQQQQQPQHNQTQQQYQSQPQTQQHVIDPNTGAAMNPPYLGSGYEQVSDPNAQMQQRTPQAEPLKEMIMDPIFPADTKNGTFYSHHVKNTRNYHYNTLGQPVQMLDPKMYHSAEPPLPQTLSPQPIVLKPKHVPQFSNVKNTVSKTSIIGNGTVGRTASRNQLQHLYNQYKGSHSYTQQNINAPVQHHSQSEGRLNDNVNAARPHPVPVEKFGGDTIANNVVVNQEMNKPEQPAPVPMGDVPANKPQGDFKAEKDPPMANISTKGRNGLQDMVYTSGPTSTAWSFHGNNHLPYSTAYRFRTKVR